MDINKVKKLLYRQNPIAKFSYIRKGSVYYISTIKDVSLGSLCVVFEIPINDLENVDFFPEMNAKLLIRWILKIMY